MPNPANYPPVTAAGLAVVVVAVLSAFTDLTGDQTAAIGGAVAFAAAAVSAAFTRSRRSLRQEGKL